MRTPVPWMPLVLVGLAGLTAGCGQRQGADATPRFEEKVVRITPAKSNARISFLTAELTDVRVFERVNAETGEVVYGPRLYATLKLRNHVEDQTARLVGGELTYLDGQGRPIKLAEGREDPNFTFSSYGGDRLDPGAEVSRDIDVPFPVSALKDGALAEVRLSISYMPSPYREAAIGFPVSLAR
jgi:hypothetical protein